MGLFGARELLFVRFPLGSTIRRYAQGARFTKCLGGRPVGADRCQGGDMSRRPASASAREHLRIITIAAGIFVGVSLLVPREAPGTVEEQRARLPPPAECDDPVVGVWKSHRYSARQAQWTEFTLNIHRVPGSETQLTGEILNHSWGGTPKDEQPPPCHGDLRYRVSMDSQGSVYGYDVEFWGVGKWRLDEVLCGYAGFGYNLDHFSGTIDPELQEFQSVNNDGGVAVNEPTVFRRIKCFNDKGAGDPHVDPPPFHPPRSFCGF